MMSSRRLLCLSSLALAALCAAGALILIFVGSTPLAVKCHAHSV